MQRPAKGYTACRVTMNASHAADGMQTVSAGQEPTRTAHRAPVDPRRHQQRRPRRRIPIPRIQRPQCPHLNLASHQKVTVCLQSHLPTAISLHRRCRAAQLSQHPQTTRKRHVPPYLLGRMACECPKTISRVHETMQVAHNCPRPCRCLPRVRVLPRHLSARTLAADAREQQRAGLLCEKSGRDCLPNLYVLPRVTRVLHPVHRPR